VRGIQSAHGLPGLETCQNGSDDRGIVLHQDCDAITNGTGGDYCVRETVSRSIQLAIGRVPGPAPKRNFIRKVLGGRLEHSMQVRELLLQRGSNSTWEF
jgi:hypothetical protein